MERKYRTKLMILRDFLLAVSKEKKKTRIMYAANMNPVTFNKYLSKYLSEVLIEKQGDFYQITKKGEQTLEMCEKILEKISEIEELMSANSVLDFSLAELLPFNSNSNKGKRALKEYV